MAIDPRARSHKHHLISIIPDAWERCGKAIMRRIELRSQNDIVPEHEIPAYLDCYAPGRTYGRYKERIIKREVRRESVPPWFDARKHNSGQFGIIDCDGLRVYVIVELNHEARSGPSTFDEEIVKLVIPNHTQYSMFDELD